MIKNYTDNDSGSWNAFLENSRSSTFLFNRGFMDYHSDRFNDFSLMYYSGGNPIGLLPANIDEKGEVHSHQGLSYGSFITKKDSKSNDVFNFFIESLKFLSENQVEVLNFKRFPDFYNQIPSMDIGYLLFVTEAKLYRRDITSLINLREKIKFQTRRKRSIKKSKSYGLRIKEENKFENFWNKNLIPNLKQRHNLNPVHSVSEITMLQNRFQKNILQFNIYKDESVIGGATIFKCGRTIHVQYIASNDEGKEKGALDLLFDFLINERFADELIFDFGISTYDAGTKINWGLLEWKEGFRGKNMEQ